MDWWNDSQRGLRQRVLTQLPADTLNTLSYTLKQNHTLTDQALQRLLSPSAAGYAGANTLVGGTTYSHVMMMVGIGYNGLSSYPKLYAIEQAAPIFRAVLLLLFYAFLPFGLVLSGYRFSPNIS